MNKKGVNKWIIFFALLIGIILIYYLFKKYGLPYLKNNATDSYTNTFESIAIFIVVVILSYFFIKFSSQLLKSYLISNGEKRRCQSDKKYYRHSNQIGKISRKSKVGTIYASASKVFLSCFF